MKQLVDKIDNESEFLLKESKLSVNWKYTNIVPSHKEENKEEPTNYRSASLTSVLA